MDPETEKLIERTRQRREMLNQKMGKTPEAAPRKRRTPLMEDLSDNVNTQNSGQQPSEDSPKRQCVREDENQIKADTPAIPSVRSRLHNLASQHCEWSDVPDAEETKATPVPIPRKSLSSPLHEEPKVPEQENTLLGSSRKSRFAQLAKSINNWEDDLSHPTIVKEEEKKPRWQPPKPVSAPSVPEISSAKKGPAPPPPSAAHSRLPSARPASPKKTSAPPPPQPAAPAVEKTPVTRSASRAGFNSSPKPFKPYEEKSVKISPVKSPVCSKSNLAATKDKHEALQPVVQSADTVEKKDMQTPLASTKPAERPLSARLANWEQKISESASKPDVVATPKSGFAASTRVGQTPKQVCTLARPLSTPAKDVADVQMRPKVRKSIDDEPTAHSVSARMSAWEQITSANVVSESKKVRPGDCTPIKTPANKSPASGKPPFGTIPGKAASTPGAKSFQDSIKERASQVNPRASAAGSSPGKSASVSPAKASPAMKSVQQRLIEQTQSMDMAQRLRQERMAELQAIQNRWKNGILREDGDVPAEEPPQPESASKTAKREVIRERARADFEDKLASIGFVISDEGKASFSFKNKPKEDQKKEASATPQPPPAPPAPSSSSTASGKPPARPTSLYNIVSQKSALMQTPPKATNNKTRCKVKFDDSFDSDDSETMVPKKQVLQKAGASKPEQPPQAASSQQFNNKPADNVTESDTTEVTEDDSEFEVTLRRPRPDGTQKVVIRPEACDDDDLSLSAFVPASVRRQSILPSPKRAGREQDLNSSLGSVDSFEGVPGAPPDIHKSTVNLVRLGRQHADSSSSLTSQSTVDSSSDAQRAPGRSGYSPDATEESVDERDAIGDLLDEAMDSDSEDQPTVSGKLPVARKRQSHMMATKDREDEGNLPFSLSSYRASRNSQIAEVKQTIVRNSQYAGMCVEEEAVKMPTRPAAPVSRQTIQERIRELQELIQQEQNVIMQTSNALNQCCSNNSYFAGSAEQVECNRLLLIACQKRQSYMTEIQRLKDTGCLDDGGPGPRGSLTISDIRLPLKREFVTKIGTSHDTTTFYFILLLRNGPQLIATQMLSSHDPMMRGSLDFPNLIKINGITGQFKLSLDIYCMSVSREPTGKDKKKKTPRKVKGSSMTVQSPGGPMAVHTTSFTQVTSIPLTMKSLDKHCFQLERLSYLSPLHGTIYMNLKCLMEASVEEKGFLTMFEDVSGLGSWHRRWCVLGGNKLSFWKYPDDEMRKDPMGYIDLKRCITEKVGLIARDICARPNTFELVTVRQPRKGERDTLISRTYSTMTTIRHMLSADTKEERIVWCNKLNRALANIRTWNADAMRPVSSSSSK